ncbi:MAG: 50S ribosomal protein L4 [Spirochaetales bacterium]|nr:50S ribosomal protein L4 [Spirochaetales bacterium]
MRTKVFSIEGQSIKEIDLADGVFGIKVSEGAIYHALRNELANRRQGTASTKTRKEIHGSNQKPWRQKGTGRARAGDKKSPLWVGGGTVFGPKPRDYSYKMPRKLKQLAMKSLLSLKLKEEKLQVVEDIALESGKTKDLVRMIQKLAKMEKTVIILNTDDKMMKRAGANVPWLTLLQFNKLRAHELFYSQHVLLCEQAATSLNTFFGEKK